MEIFRKTDYALCMLALLAQDDGALLSVRGAAEEIGVPYSFARSIQHGLVQADIVESLRGVHGGMRLKADPSELTLLRIAEAMQGPVADEVEDGALRDGSCYHAIWSGAQALVASYLNSVTLDDVVNHHQNPAVEPMFADRSRFDEYAVCASKDGVE